MNYAPAIGGRSNAAGRQRPGRSPARSEACSSRPGARPCLRARRAARGGFTLLELVLVLGIIALVAMAAAPALGGWSRGGQVRNQAEMLVASVRQARAEAVATGRVHRLEISGERSWRITASDGLDMLPAAGELGRARSLPEGWRIELRRHDGAIDPLMDLYPSGRSSPVTIELTAPWGEVVVLESPSVVEPLRRVGQEVRR